MAVRYCSNCGKTCEHKEIIKQKPSPYGKSRKEQFKAFLSGFSRVSLWARDWLL
ncbi:hypothetical protein JCM19238_3680 [Vibrio ponticus]|nr:hypothetical protein JCM19238_3680 [Vibrio ponticus]